MVSQENDDINLMNQTLKTSTLEMSFGSPIKFDKTLDFESIEALS